MKKKLNGKRQWGLFAALWQAHCSNVWLQVWTASGCFFYKLKGLNLSFVSANIFQRPGRLCALWTGPRYLAYTINQLKVVRSYSYQLCSKYINLNLYLYVNNWCSKREVGPTIFFFQCTVWWNDIHRLLSDADRRTKGHQSGKRLS